MSKEKAKFYKASLTEKGRRRLNEDCCQVLSKETNNNFGYMVLVADGLGGLERGEIVSGYIKQSLKKWYEEKAEDLFKMSTHEIKHALNEEIYSIHEVLLANSISKKTSYGSTLTCFLCMNSRYVIAHVGDSRCYISYRNNIRQLTKDQTQYQKLLDAHEEIPAEKKVKMQSTLLQCIGHGKVSPHYYEGIMPDEYELLLCTDGFYRKLTNEDITRFFLSKNMLDVRLKETVNMILSKGETDNITAVLLKKTYETEL